MKIVAPILLILSLLSACATQTTVHINSISPVCSALIGPIRYNSTNQSSPRFAGRVLARDLHVRNAVGVNLRCPKYR